MFKGSIEVDTVGTGTNGSGNSPPKDSSKPFDIKLETLAKADYLEAIEKYEREVEGLGRRFKVAVDDLLKRIAENPFV